MQGEAGKADTSFIPSSAKLLRKCLASLGHGKELEHVAWDLRVNSTESTADMSAVTGSRNSSMGRMIG